MLGALVNRWIDHPNCPALETVRGTFSASILGVILLMASLPLDYFIARSGALDSSYYLRLVILTATVLVCCCFVAILVFAGQRGMLIPNHRLFPVCLWASMGTIQLTGLGVILHNLASGRDGAHHPAELMLFFVVVATLIPMPPIATALNLGFIAIAHTLGMEFLGGGAFATKESATHTAFIASALIIAIYASAVRCRPPRIGENQYPD